MSLLNRHVFSPEMAEKIERMGLLAEQIADRWAGGWPKRVKALEKSGQLLSVLKAQVEQEKEVLAQARNLSHLARHEIMELFEIRPEPPEE